jgi:hypothetical protein
MLLSHLLVHPLLLIHEDHWTGLLGLGWISLRQDIALFEQHLPTVIALVGVPIYVCVFNSHGVHLSFTFARLPVCPLDSLGVVIQCYFMGIHMLASLVQIIHQVIVPTMI